MLMLLAFKGDFMSMGTFVYPYCNLNPNLLLYIFKTLQVTSQLSIVSTNFKAVSQISQYTTALTAGKNADSVVHCTVPDLANLW